MPFPTLSHARPHRRLRADRAPRAPFAPLALLAAVALFAFSGCATSVSRHHVQSAEARTVAPVPVPALNPSTGKLVTLAGVRVSQGSAGVGEVRTANVGDEIADVEIYRSYPGNYDLRRDPMTVGLEYQAAFLPQFDVFMALEATPRSAQRGAAIAGLGITLPIPALHVRLAPALGGHVYRMAVVDSIHIRTTFFDEVEDSIRVDRQDTHRLGMLASMSVSAWVPRAITGTPLVPFAQFQWSLLDMRSRTLPEKVLRAQAYVLAGGADYETSWGHVRARVAREALGGRGYSAAWRADLGLHARLSSGGR